MEIKDKYLTANSERGLQKIAQMPGWTGHRSEKYEHFVLEAGEPQGAEAFASVLGGLVDYRTAAKG